MADISTRHEPGYGACAGAVPDAGKSRDAHRIIRAIVASAGGMGTSKGMSETQKGRMQQRIMVAKGT